MFLACLLFGAMPVQMALSMPTATGKTVSSQTPIKHDAHSHHSDRDGGSHTQGKNAPYSAAMGGCCPHGDNAAHPGSCAACLIVVPRTIFADAGRMTFAYPKPQRSTLFNGEAFAPPLPPPRA